MEKACGHFRFLLSHLKFAAMIDLRSDTFTKPTPAMLKAMFNAEVGDDVFGEDPTINALEKKAAELFGMEGALFCPSGTMTNQIAIKVHTKPGDEVICHPYSHIYVYEGGGMAFNSGVQPKIVEGARGLITAKDVEEAIAADDIHAAHSSLVSVENTMNKGGGACYDLAELEAIAEVARKHGLKFHLDGARLFNALAAKGGAPKDYGRIFDSISICLSKGLGCPVGSLILGDAAFIREARRVRKKFGGGMRQAGYLAAAGIYALDHHVERLKEDHEKAQVLKDALLNCSWVERTDPVETNIVIFYLKDGKDQQEFVEKLKQQDILLIGMGQGKLRMVTHLDINFEAVEKVADVLEEM